MPNINYHNAHFLLSAHELKHLPPDQGLEVAFIGRSNSGKSSVLNKLTGQKNLARTSKTPGRTQLINLFMIDDIHCLVDLPGYGYAKVPMAIKLHWQTVLGAYLRKRRSLRGLVLVMDIRHPLREYDQQLLKWADACKLSVHILLNKVDKLGVTQAKQTLRTVEKSIAVYGNQVSVQTFSALKGTGLDDLREIIDHWFNNLL